MDQIPARHALFEGVPPSTLESLLDRCEIRSLRVGEVLLAPGQINKHLYLLLEGQLQVRIDRIDSEQGFPIGPGEYTGEISVIDCQPATAFVVASEPSQVLVLNEEEIWERLFPVPRIARNFMRLFADRFRARNEAMRKSLEQQLRYEHLQKELAIAHEIQLGMLPRDLDLEPAIEVVADMIPAQQVGGDFYDFFPVNPEEYGVAIGDVSGKGISAALFMVRTMILLRTELLKDRPIDEAVRGLNVMLCEENPTCMFATLIAGILNKRTGVFRYVNAGHDAVVFGERGVNYRPLPPPRGILVGLDPGATYEVASLVLDQGDVVLLYTDGVTEAMNHDRHLFTVDRLMECLRQMSGVSPQELAERIKRAVREFTAGAPPSDDVTLLILRYQGAWT